MTGFLPITILQ